MLENATDAIGFWGMDSTISVLKEGILHFFNLVVVIVVEKFFSKHYKFKLALFKNYYILKYHTKSKNFHFLIKLGSIEQSFWYLFFLAHV